MQQSSPAFAFVETGRSTGSSKAQQTKGQMAAQVGDGLVKSDDWTHSDDETRTNRELSLHVQSLSVFWGRRLQPAQRDASSWTNSFDYIVHLLGLVIALS